MVNKVERLGEHTQLNTVVTIPVPPPPPPPPPNTLIFKDFFDLSGRLPPSPEKTPNPPAVAVPEAAARKAAP